MKLASGTVLKDGMYVIEETLGQGSYGITYRASMRFIEGPLGRIPLTVAVPVAIKEFFLRETNVRGTDGHTLQGSQGKLFTDNRQRFRREATNLSRLIHDNIVRVSDVFDENDTTYFVMQYIEGETLNQYLKRCHPLTEKDAAGIIRNAALALGYMHDNGMLHLDLKPDNIMRGNDGHIYLVDFGLSKQFNGAGVPETSAIVGRGTPGYAPIEQANYTSDKEIPVTLDIYALGATFFKLLTGCTPPHASDIVEDGVPQEPFIKEARSKKYIDIIVKAMSPRKRDRYQGVGAFIQALDAEVSSVVDSVEATIVAVKPAENGKENQERRRLEEQLFAVAKEIKEIWGGWENVKYHCDKRRYEELVRQNEKADISLLRLGEKFERLGGNEENLKRINKLRFFAVHFSDEIKREVGIMFDEANEINTNPGKGYEWYKRAAEKGFAEAQYKLGQFYYSGKGVRQDSLEALKWYRKAVEQSHSSAKKEIIPLLKKFGEPINNHEWVDLGLPSGTLWATCNVGASAPEETGDYFAWGEYNPKEVYSENTYFIKKNDFPNYITFINKPKLPSRRDVAWVNWGEGWRMPSSSEFEELSKVCNWEKDKVNGKNGCRITGPSGKSIFIPAAGFRRDSSAENVGTVFYYSTVNSGQGNNFYKLLKPFSIIKFQFSEKDNLFYGLPLRPVVSG